MTEVSMKTQRILDKSRHYLNSIIEEFSNYEITEKDMRDLMDAENDSAQMADFADRLLLASCGELYKQFRMVEYSNLREIADLSFEEYQQYRRAIMAQTAELTPIIHDKFREALTSKPAMLFKLLAKSD